MELRVTRSCHIREGGFKALRVAALDPLLDMYTASLTFHSKERKGGILLMTENYYLLHKINLLNLCYVDYLQSKVDALTSVYYYHIICREQILQAT